jgi:hypothetical protein
MGYARTLFEGITIVATYSYDFTGTNFVNLFELISIIINDPAGAFDYPDVGVTNPDGRDPVIPPRYIIPPFLPPEIMQAMVGTAFVFYVIFWGVPYMEESKKNAYNRREYVRWRLHKLFLFPIKKQKRKVDRQVAKAKGTVNQQRRQLSARGRVQQGRIARARALLTYHRRRLTYRPKGEGTSLKATIKQWWRKLWKAEKL